MKEKIILPTLSQRVMEFYFLPGSLTVERSLPSKRWMRLATWVLLGALGHGAQNSNVDPPVSQTDLRIVRRARDILNSPGKWNRADDRNCPAAQTTYSLYCALEKATEENSGRFEHRGAAMQQARFVIDEALAPGNHYEHRLKDYNNDPKTTFADVQKFFSLLEERIRKRLDRQRGK